MRTFTLVEEDGEEADPYTDDQDALFKHVFDNLRNALICAALALTGAGIIKWRADLEFFGSNINATIGILLIVTAFFLCGWNIVNGRRNILIRAGGGARVALYILASLVYGFLVFVVFQAWAMVQPKQLRIATSDIMIGKTQDGPVPLVLTLDCSLDPEIACIKSVVLLPPMTDQENREDMLGSSVASFFIEGYIPWLGAGEPPQTFSQQISYHSNGNQGQ